MRLQPDTEHPHGLSDRDYDALFTTDKPVIFAYHGYPWLIHRLTYRRHGHDNLHVRGYKEEGTVTTPFDMVVLNDMDRFHLVMDVIDRVPGLGAQRRARAPAHGRRAHATRRVHARVRRGHARGARLDLARLMADRRVRRAGRQRGLEQPEAAGARRRTTRSRPSTTSSVGTPTDEATEFAGSLDAMPAFDAVGHRVVHGGRAVPRRRSASMPATERALLDARRRSRRCTSPAPSPGIALLRRLLSRSSAGCVLRHRVPRDAARRRRRRTRSRSSGATGGDCSASASTGSPTRTRRAAPPSSSAASAIPTLRVVTLPSRRGRVAVRDAWRSLGRHDDGLHAARGARDGDPFGNGRSRPRACG